MRMDKADCGHLQPGLQMTKYLLFNGDARTSLVNLPDESVDCCITSPPYYGLRDYGCELQIGLEETPYDFIDSLANVFDEVKRVLKSTGTLWVVIGDSYAGSMKAQGWNQDKNTWKASKGSDNQSKKLKPYTDDVIKARDLIGIPWMLAFELRKRGWYLRQDIIWNKTNVMPESVLNRCTRSHEYIFLFSKIPTGYYFDYEAIMEPVVDSTGPRCRRDIERQEGFVDGFDGEKKAARYGGKKYTSNDEGFFRTKSENAYQPRDRRFKRDVWTAATARFSGNHFAVFPEHLVKPMILAGCPREGVVLDPFSGTGTTGVVAMQNGRGFIGCELNRKYCVMSDKRLREAWEASPMLV